VTVTGMVRTTVIVTMALTESDNCTRKIVKNIDIENDSDNKRDKRRG
jgi:hypothetical protein